MMKLWFASLFTALLSSACWASSLECTSPGHQSRLVLHEKTVEFLLVRDLQGGQRTPASVVPTIARFQAGKIVRLLNYNGYRFRISLDPETNVGTVQYRNRQGHELMLPLDCQSID